jgi:hypothetical protein
VSNRETFLPDKDVRIGSAEAPSVKVNWRKELAGEDERDDDELPAKTPRDVVEGLGFDPRDLDENGA